MKLQWKIAIYLISLETYINVRLSTIFLQKPNSLHTCNHHNKRKARKIQLNQLSYGKFIQEEFSIFPRKIQIFLSFFNQIVLFFLMVSIKQSKIFFTFSF